MIDLTRLATSLTKHGAHKIAYLLEKYGKDGVLDKLRGVEPNINIDSVQARKNLSASGGVVPEVWDKARAAGSESIRALVLIGIIFSHHELIGAMRASRGKPFRGDLDKGKMLSVKHFSNIAHIIEELGYSVSHNSEHVTYNLSKMFEIPGLNKLALELLPLKLKTAGWDGKTGLVDELVNGKFNEVFSISQEQFRNWLTTGDVDAIGETLEDEDYFLDTDDTGPQTPFVFVPGHTPKKTGVVPIAASKAGGRAELLHNELQTALDSALVGKYGRDAVGTEQKAGGGTSIDLVVKTASECWFYEIKVAKTVKACIRQAIPQLLEYAYWRKDSNVADKLYIASKFKLTKDAEEYLDLLRKRFNLPLYYERIIL
ncbi:MAG: hypothetical protein IV105_16025 [Rhizobacter sp.]|nr:hypothetical protein [Rhizobacter sp.]